MVFNSQNSSFHSGEPITEKVIFLNRFILIIALNNMIIRRANSANEMEDMVRNIFMKIMKEII